jgi:hypothetical protein
MKVMNYFNSDGRRIPSKDLRVFGDTPKYYYQLKQPVLDYSKILYNSIRFGEVDSEVDSAQFKSACENLKTEIKNNQDFANLFNGVHIPFICKRVESVNDLGKDLEAIELPGLQKSFNEQFPGSHFKAILQSNSELPGSISLDPRARYEGFLDKAQQNTVIGWYFPQALQEFDVESQRKQMEQLPEVGNVCLSGGIDVAAALIGSPDLLISEDFYAPILCLSAYVHSDSRLVLLLKSYGPHMEFWCMTQMLSRDITQVSEQWAGGITVYSQI